MAIIVADRVLETSTTTGAGAYTLGGAIVGYRPASVVCANGDTFTYYADDVDSFGRSLGSWETGLGTWGTGGILTRTTIYASSNGNASVSWVAGTRRIAIALVSNAVLGPTTIVGDLAATNFSGSSSGTNTGDQSASSILSSLLAVDGAGSGLDADLLDGINSSVFLRNNQAVTTVGSGVAGEVWLDVANPGVGNSSGFRFIKSSDSAGLSVTENTSDSTQYEFYMADNPDGGDNFSWRFTDWQGSNGLWQPIQLGGMNSQYVARAHSFYGSISQPTTNAKYFTTSNIGGAGTLSLIQSFNSVSRLKISGSGSITITSLDVSGYTGGTGVVFTIKLTSATTFDWGYGHSTFTPVQSGLTVLATPQALSNGVSVTFSSSTGGLINDIFQCRIYQAPINSFGGTTITSLILGTPLSMSSGGTGNTVGSSTRLITPDTRATNPAPQAYSVGITSDFKQNTADGLVDGGTYHGVLSFRQYANASDWTGGGIRQLGFTDNNNIWVRGANGDTTWSTWRRFAFTDSPIFTGDVTSQTFISNIVTGTAPFIVSSATRVVNLNADLLDGIDGANYTRLDTTNLGKVSNVSLDGVTNTPALWSALPVGYSCMMHTTIGTAGGAPINGDYGYFTKTANRDSGGGWGGLWQGYTASQGSFFGVASTSANLPTWDRIWTAATDGAGSGLDADLLDGLQTSSTNVASTVVIRDVSGNFSGNAITANSFAGSSYATSDRRAKDNIRPLEYGLNDIIKLMPKKFEMKTDGSTSIGLIAQEVEGLIPEIVTQISDEYKGINYSLLVSVLINAVKELKEEIEELKLNMK